MILENPTFCLSLWHCFTANGFTTIVKSAIEHTTATSAWGPGMDLVFLPFPKLLSFPFSKHWEKLNLSNENYSYHQLQILLWCYLNRVGSPLGFPSFLLSFSSSWLSSPLANHSFISTWFPFLILMSNSQTSPRLSFWVTFLFTFISLMFSPIPI